MYAIIETGGKQYRVAAGDRLQVEVLDGMIPDAPVRFDRVLFMSDGSEVRVGTPTVQDARVEGTVVRLDRGPKVLVFKKKRRKQYRRTRGHRQDFAEVRIDALVFPGGERHAAPAEKKAARKPKAEKAAPGPRKKAATGGSAGGVKKPAASKSAKKASTARKTAARTKE